MPSRAEHSRPLTSRTGDVLLMVDNVKNYQSWIIVLDMYKSTSCHLPSISLVKNFTFQRLSFYVLHFTYKIVYVFVLQFYDPYLVVQFMYIKNPLDQQIEQVSTFRISSLRNCLRLIS